MLTLGDLFDEAVENTLNNEEFMKFAATNRRQLLYFHIFKLTTNYALLQELDFLLISEEKKVIDWICRNSYKAEV